MNDEIPLTAIEATGARAAFLRLREAADLPSGGEVTLKAEVRQIAEKMGLRVPDDWTRERIMYETWCESRRREYGAESFERTHGHVTWEYVQTETFARSFTYFQSSEAHLLAKQIENSTTDTNEPFDFLEVPDDLQA